MTDETGEPLIRATMKSLVVLALLALTMLSGRGRNIGVEATIPEPTETPRPTQTATPIPTPTSTPTPIPTVTPIPTSTPTPTSTPDPILEIAAQYTLDAVVPWGSAVEHFFRAPLSLYTVEYEDLTLELVLGVMANESNGDMSLVSHMGACGLMQVIPKTWFPENPHELCTSPFANIRAGMRILQLAIDIAQEQGEDGITYGLAYYNCSEKGVHSDGCGPTGGLHYAEEILTFWVPRIQKRIAECSEKWGSDYYWQGLTHYGCNYY